MDKFVKFSLILSVIISSQVIFASSHGDHKTHVVQMKNIGTLGSMVFEPSFLKINLGDSVLFEMADAGHNAVTVAAPSGSKPFDTKYEPSTKVTFDVKGLYLYKCAPHAMMAMAGIIQVADANNSQEIIAAIQKFEATVMMPNAKTRISDLFKENVKNASTSTVRLSGSSETSHTQL